VEKDRVLSVPETGPDTEMASAMRVLLSQAVPACSGAAGQFPVGDVPTGDPIEARATDN
jgi:hypothetical protein